MGISAISGPMSAGTCRPAYQWCAAEQSEKHRWCAGIARFDTTLVSEVYVQVNSSYDIDKVRITLLCLLVHHQNTMAEASNASVC